MALAIQDIKSYFHKLVGIAVWFQAASAAVEQQQALEVVLRDMQPYLGETYPLAQQTGHFEIRGFCIPTTLIKELHYLARQSMPGDMT